MNKILSFLLLSACLLSASLVTLARPIRGASAASSEEFPDIDLPYDAQVEYIEFTGTQRIVTDIVPKVYSGSCIVIDYQLTRTDIRQVSGAPSSYVEFCSSKGMVIYDDSNVFADVNRHVMDCRGDMYPRSIIYEDMQLRTGSFVLSTSEDPQRCFTLGALRKDMQHTPLYARVFSFTIRDKFGEWLMWLVPVRFTNELGEWEGAMYDRVSGELFRNAGSGYFVIGPDKE